MQQLYKQTILFFTLFLPFLIWGQSVKNETTQVDFTTVRCLGDINEKTVTIFFKITNHSNQKHVIHLIDNGDARALVDTSTKYFACKNYSLGNHTGGENYLINITLTPDTTIEGSITYKGIPVDAKKISKATFFYYDNLRNANDEQIANESGIVDLGAVNIVWQKPKKTKLAEPRHYFGASAGIKSIYFKNGYSESNPINTSLVYERKVKNLPLSIGGAISFCSHTYNYENDYGTESFSFKENAIYVGLRANGYFNDYVGLSKKYESYLGLSCGYIFLFDTENSNNSNTAKSGFASGIHIGVRRYFTPNFGLWAEGGTSSLSYINGGLIFKF